jgi:hypothetical protein
MLVQSAFLAIAAIGASATPAHSVGANVKARVAGAAVGASAPPTAHLKARQETKEPVIPADESYVATEAPRENIFRGITDDESSDIYDWFDRHGNSSSLYVFGPAHHAAHADHATHSPSDMSFYSSPWLLAPNKTEAIDYLENNGTKPLRYARIMGSGDCVDTEYMIGPLPISDETKASPLAYANHGNPSLDLCIEDGDEEDDDFEDRRRRKRSEHMERAKARRGIHRRSPQVIQLCRQR